MEILIRAENGHLVMRLDHFTAQEFSICIVSGAIPTATLDALRINQKRYRVTTDMVWNAIPGVSIYLWEGYRIILN
jgi:hypothetical protein